MRGPVPEFVSYLHEAELMDVSDWRPLHGFVSGSKAPHVCVCFFLGNSKNGSVLLMVSL